MPTTEPSFNPGNRFEIRRTLGSGGMGVVYEAFDRERQELVALKTLQRVDGTWISRLKSEFRSLHDLAHRNLVDLGELFDGEDGPFFTMELVRGVDFLTHVRGAGGDGKSYDEAKLRAALKQLAVGIAALHDAGKVHRDIKPSNILVTPDGRVVLLDFGLVADTAGRMQTGEPSAAGSVAYIAPEQARSNDAAPAADWYSLGVILYEALTGTRPYSGRTPSEIISRKQRITAPPPRRFVPTVPGDLDRLCCDLLRRDAARRPSASDLFERLGLDRRSRLLAGSSGPLPDGPAKVPFVGRTEELATLSVAYEGLGSAPLFLLVEGVSGVGKSKLVEEFLDQLSSHDPDAVVLSARCYERETVSYKAFDGIAESLADYLVQLPTAEVAELMPGRASLLGRLFPSLRRVEAIAAAPREPDAPDPHDQRRSMFASLRELFVRLGRRRRLVWSIDDLHWTDADSLDLLQELVAHEVSPPVLIIATIRPADTESRRALVERIKGLARTEHLLLDDLPPRDARSLAGLLLPDKDPTVLDALAADAGGHPLFLHELARHLAITSAPHGGVTLDEMIGARMSLLPAELQSLLQVICVFGGPLTQEVASLAAGLSFAGVVKAARVLHAAHLVRTDGVRRTDRIVVYHDRVREHVSEHLDAERKRAIHERLALALEQTGAAQHDPRMLVRHARAAGQHGLAGSYALTAARYAVESLEFNLAAELFATALELGGHDDSSQRQLRIDLAGALVNAGRGPEAAAMYLAAAQGADAAVRLSCQRRAAEQWIITGHIPQGLAALSTSLQEIGEPFAPTPRRALARVLWNRFNLRLRGIGHRHRTESQVPLEELRRLDVLRATAHGLAMVDNIHGADFNGRFLRQALRTGEPHRLVQALGTEVIFLASQGGSSARRGRKIFARLEQLAREDPDNAYYRAWVHLADGAASFFEGRFKPAAPALEQGEDAIAETAGSTYERNNLRVWRVHVTRQLGAFRQNAALIAESARAGLQRGDLYLETTLRTLYVHPLLCQGDTDLAHTTLAQLRWSPPEGGYHVQHWYELEARGELALYEGRAAEAVGELAPSFAGLEASMLLRVNSVRTKAIGLRARLLLAAALDGYPGDEVRGEVTRIARRLARERTGYATVYEQLLRAGLAGSGPDPSDQATIAFLRVAMDTAQESHMALHLAVARHALGTLMGGDEGAELNALAKAWADHEGVGDAPRLFQMFAPGCVGSATERL